MIKYVSSEFLNFFGIARAIIAVFSIGVAHNFAFMIPFPHEFWFLVDSQFLAGITTQYAVFISGSLLLSVFFMQLSGVIRGFILGLLVSHLEKKRKGKLYPLKKRNRYFGLVRHNFERIASPISLSLSLFLSTSILGYFYAGLMFFVSLPIMMVLFLFTMPILYPRLNVGIVYVEGKKANKKNINEDFLVSFLSSTSNLKQLAAFVMSFLILTSGYLGFVRHHYLKKEAVLSFHTSDGDNILSGIGKNAQGYIVFDHSKDKYYLISYDTIDMVR